MDGKRRAAWTWRSVWTLPGNMVATTSSDPIRLRDEQLQLDTELKRLVLEAERCPQNLRNIELKYKHSDWELARTKTPICLPIEGYIQSMNHKALDLDNLNLWFNANWSPVLDQLRRNPTYKAWAEEDPAYRHVQVSGAPAVATAGRHKKDTEVRRAPASSPSAPLLLPRIRCFDAHDACCIHITLIASYPHLSLPPPFARPLPPRMEGFPKRPQDLQHLLLQWPAGARHQSMRR
jgi:hypothetical protein